MSWDQTNQLVKRTLNQVDLWPLPPVLQAATPGKFMPACRFATGGFNFVTHVSRLLDATAAHLRGRPGRDAAVTDLCGELVMRLAKLMSLLQVQVPAAADAADVDADVAGAADDQQQQQQE
ncbi:unnamed protein product [Trichogramma brassicae]|uniref:Uncharacterized protein n=1 Tax=Trichogramma brassicae TaxID=86971 RepID=A0A6H5IM65_9HYME|nr:unnamed protein product [Trichogramma brassicae]